MLPQKTRKRVGRHRFQQTPRALMASCASPREDLRGALAGLEILRLRQRGHWRKTADQKRNRR